MSPNYCRRESAGKPCNKAITKTNALNWCEGCRAERLPFWPTSSKPATPQVEAMPGMTPLGIAPTKEVSLGDPRALDLFGAAVAREVR